MEGVPPPPCDAASPPTRSNQDDAENRHNNGEAESRDGRGIRSLISKPQVPSAKILRMLLNVLKYNPVGAIKDVGVSLILLCSAIEVSPPHIEASTRRTSGDNRLHSRSRGQCMELKRQAEATKVLALARRTARRKTDRNSNNHKNSNNNDKNNNSNNHNDKNNNKAREMTKKIGEGLKKWATQRGRDIPELKTLLLLSSDIRPSDARLVQHHALSISSECAAKALPEADAVLRFISNAVDFAVRESARSVDESQSDESKDNGPKGELIKAEKQKKEGETGGGVDAVENVTPPLTPLDQPNPCQFGDPEGGQDSPSPSGRIDNVAALKWATVGGVELESRQSAPPRNEGRAGGDTAGDTSKEGKSIHGSDHEHEKAEARLTAARTRLGGSNLRNGECYVEQDKRLRVNPPFEKNFIMERREAHREWKLRQPEREEARKKVLEKRAKNNGLFPHRGLGDAWVATVPSPLPPALTPYPLNDWQKEMAKRWPGGLPQSSKALVSQLPRLEDVERWTFEAAFEKSSRRRIMGEL